MVDTIKTLGQSAPAATTLTALYTVPGATQAVGNTLTICNRHASNVPTCRVSVAPAGAADANSQYIMWDVPISPGNPVVLTIGISLAATDVVRVYSSTADLSFSLFGIEVT